MGVVGVAGVDLDHYLAPRLAVADVLHGVHRLGEREHPVDGDGEVSGVQVLSQREEVRVVGGGEQPPQLLSPADRQQCRAQVPSNPEDFGAGRLAADDDQDAARRERSQQGPERAATGAVDDDIEPMGRGVEVPGGVVDDVGRAEVPDGSHFGGAADPGHLGAGEPRELHREAADSPSGTDHRHLLTCVHGALIAYCLERGGTRGRDRGRLHSRDRRGSVDQGVGATPSEFGHGTADRSEERFGQLVRNFIAFHVHDNEMQKRIAKPHQYFAVTKAVGSTIDAVTSNGKAGVVWHTQGAGKSMEMELYAHLVHTRSELLNPTIVVVTDRTELDGQLFDTFRASRLLPEEPVKITSRAELRSALSARDTGGILFTTLQKFGRTQAERDSGADHPLLSDRRNIIVVVDEAHRSHYDDLDGYARHLKDPLPKATLIAFTGTPISFSDRNTRETFGDYIDIYDLTRAVEDGATVPVHFEPRLIQVSRADGVSEEQIDDSADELTAGLDDVERERIEASVAIINAIYGAPARIEALATDLVAHWEQRRAVMSPFIGGPGKALVVGATRQICADLYAAIVALRPEWHADGIDAGRIKVVYSGTPSDPAPIAQHVRRESQNKAIKQRLREVDDELEIVIVKDMMLTGYDSPPLHTLCLDRPLKGALLMQTLARVNRTYRGKQDGLLVAYAPLAENLDKALAEYTDADQQAKPVGRDIGGLSNSRPR